LGRSVFSRPSLCPRLTSSSDRLGTSIGQTMTLASVVLILLVLVVRPMAADPTSCAAGGSCATVDDTSMLQRKLQFPQQGKINAANAVLMPGLPPSSRPPPRQPEPAPEKISQMSIVLEHLDILSKEVVAIRHDIREDILQRHTNSSKLDIVSRDPPPGVNMWPSPPTPAPTLAPDDAGPEDLDYPSTFDKFVEQFLAHDPEYQSWCKQVLVHGTKGAKGGGQHGSQNGQDLFIFRNIFARMAMKGQKGFYVESGANHWAKLSNSFFYDKCLGWEGLCVEPDSSYHKELKIHRSCKLIPGCISDKRTSLKLQGGGTGARVSATGPGNVKVPCWPLEDILADVGRTHVDLWILDVEGYEFTVLESVGWDKLSFTAVLVEDYHISTRRLDYFFASHGFVKFFQLAIDSLYTHVSHEGRPIWYPDDWESYTPPGVRR